MAIQNLAKAESLIRELKERLAFREVAGGSRYDTVRQDKDSQGYPILFLSHGGNEAAGQPVIAVRIKQIDAVSKDIFGSSMNAYAPHNAEIAYELDANSKPTPDAKDVASAMLELARDGLKIDIKEIAHNTAVTASAMDAASPAQSYENDLRWPTKGV